MGVIITRMELARQLKLARLRSGSVVLSRGSTPYETSKTSGTSWELPAGPAVSGGLLLFPDSSVVHSARLYASLSACASCGAHLSDESMCDVASCSSSQSLEAGGKIKKTITDVGCVHIYGLISRSRCDNGVLLLNTKSQL